MISILQMDEQESSCRHHLVYVPTLYPADFSMHAKKAVVEPLPLVPATLTAGHDSWGSPIAESNPLMRPCIAHAYCALSNLQGK